MIPALTVLLDGQLYVLWYIRKPMLGTLFCENSFCFIAGAAEAASTKLPTALIASPEVA